MGELLRILYSPVEPFHWHPELAFLVAGGFLILVAVSFRHSGEFGRLAHCTALVAAALWVLFGLNEYQALADGRNIRIDILFGWPPLVIISVTAAWLELRNLATSKPHARSEDEMPDGTP